LLENFYDEDCPQVKIDLDVRKTPAQNAQYYYSEYKKAVTAEEKLAVQIEKGEEELQYLDSVFDSLTRAASENDIIQLRLELREQGYIKYAGGKAKPPKALPPIEYKSGDGFTILVGRNNRQNDQLSPLELFRILMWTLEESVIGGYKTIIEDAINFLKTNGVTMCDGEIRLSFTIDDKDVCLKMDSEDDRFIRMTHYDSLESMAESLYNVFKRMNEEFGVNADVIISFKGKKGEEFASILAFLNLDKSLNLTIFN
jgi:hypothetical protein